jgi:hypothetical protein
LFARDDTTASVMRYNVGAPRAGVRRSAMEQGPEEVSENPDERAEDLRRLTDEPLPKGDSGGSTGEEEDAPSKRGSDAIDPGL